jgi:16S rRNA (cytosine967-C5)-methyltransferase
VSGTSSRAPRRREVSPARSVAYAVVRRVFEQGAYADRALHGEAAALDARDRALATRVAFGAIQRRATLDHVAEVLAGRPVETLDAAVRAALEIGLYQLLFLDGIPPHAAVSEAVELVKAQGGGAGLVNAVLRRAAREGAEVLAALRDDTPAKAAVRHSHPEWLVRMWWEQLGAEETRRLLDADNRPAELALRANTLVTTASALARDLSVAVQPALALPEGLVVEEAFDAHGSPLWEAGAFTPQSRASMLVVSVLDPQAGDSVLDLCAAPGIKSTHIAARMGGQGRVVAVERHAGRAAAMRRTCRRLRASNVEVRVADARDDHAVETFDRVLVDPPCSGLGTLRSRPDLRWRVRAEAIEELAALQAQILRAGAHAVRPGGVLVYSTCTLARAENESVVSGFLDARRDFSLDDATEVEPDLAAWEHPGMPGCLLTLPHRDGTDGFFIARLRRNPGPGPGR